MVLSLVARASGKVPSLFGYSVLNITTDSMQNKNDTPNIDPGAFILIKSVPTEELQVGDVISFYSKDPLLKGAVNTHKITAITENANGTRTFTTKGTNAVKNPINDKYPVEQDSIVGQYQKQIEWLRPLGKIAGNNTVFFLIVLIPAVIIFVMEMINTAKTRQKVEVETEEERREDEEKTRREAAAAARKYINAIAEDKPVQNTVTVGHENTQDTDSSGEDENK